MFKIFTILALVLGLTSAKSCKKISSNQVVVDGNFTYTIYAESQAKPTNHFELGSPIDPSIAEDARLLTVN